MNSNNTSGAQSPANRYPKLAKTGEVLMTLSVIGALLGFGMAFFSEIDSEIATGTALLSGSIQIFILAGILHIVADTLGRQ
ncbi:hypothetical protein [Corynebacterium sanguinis]|uniref:Uncharacterized protein n=1 Tax=Corynebacterium sanguinis TaxID=2594913 RepID=A0A6C1U087_9CORY|nr:hypothetical protein [Corynebacterium sanguinis]TVS29828.1 hypothetical protein EKI59_02595 [Corynebacterium sanguinis]